MLDSDDCTVSLDNLFFERPPVNPVKPLCQEASRWQLHLPPSISQIPSTQDIQKEAESFSPFYNLSQKPKKFLPPYKQPSPLRSPGSQSRTSDGKEAKPGHDGSSFWGGKGLLNYPQQGRDETPLGSGRAGDNKRGVSAVDFSQSPPLRRSLFKATRGQRVLHGEVHEDDSFSTNDDTAGSGQAAARPQALPARVTASTEPPAVPPDLLSSRPLQSLGPSSAASSGGRLPPAQPQPPPPPPGAGTRRACVPPMTPQPLHIQGSSGPGVLRSVSEIPAKFRSVFKEFPFFNYVQSKALDDVLYTGKNFVAGAPTGSGKTVLFELAIIHLLMETSEPWREVKAVYMAPIKALCSQRFEDWKQKFGPLGLTCKELTGDTEIDDFFEIQDAHIIMTTPEKWDSMTRRWKDNCLLQLVRLFLVDEVHVVKDLTRGATLEVVVSRMKAVHAHRTSVDPQASLSMRFVAVSATIPNIADIADWLCDGTGPATYLDMDESHRPVKLRKVVLGFPCSPNQTEFKFDLSLNYKMANIVQTYSDQKPALVFCSTRKGVQQSAAVLAKDARFIMSMEHKQRLMRYANAILDSKLKDLVMMGVGFHHAGVDMKDRKLVEEAFTMGDLPVLFTTSTLAMGVNLPAHLVVIKSTMHYVGGSCEEYSEADVLQMIGRAGRPQFDTSATAVIMTKTQTRDKYTKLMNGMEIIESSLHGHLVEHLNAEIVLQTISDVGMALDWIRSTFLYIRALKNPKHYGFSTDLDQRGIEAKLQELCLKNLNSLSSFELIAMDEDIHIKPTDAGRLMARYCVAFDTMKQFINVTGTETLAELIELLSKGKEFSDVQLRMNERRTLNTLNKDKNRITIRFSMPGKIKSNEMKVSCLIQAQLGAIPIQEFGLTQDTAKIFRNGTRISKCLSELLSQRSKTGFSAVLNSLILAKCFRAKLWENSPYVSKQLERIGLTLSTAMVNAGLTTFNKIEQANARELELIVNRHPPFGNQIKESVAYLPKYDVSLEQLPRCSPTAAEIAVTVTLKNQEQLLAKRTAPDYHYVTLVIGDSDNNVVFLQKLTDFMLLKSGSWSKKIEVRKSSRGEEISVNLISSEYVGLDIQQKFSAYYSGVKRFAAESTGPLQQEERTRERMPRTPVGQRAQLPSSTPQRENTVTVTEQGSDSGTRQCNHFCKNKETCAHECCKVGVVMTLKRPMNQGSSFSSYLKDLKNRSDRLAETPVKRLKMKINGEPKATNMQQFSYQPKAMLPVASRYVGAQYGTAVKSHPETVDLTRDDLPNYSKGNCDYVKDAFKVVGEDFSAARATRPPSHPVYLQSSPLWRKPSVIGSYGNPLTVPHSQTVNSGLSAQIPNVTFDLGNEWDDWDDCDDFEGNLTLDAREDSSSLCEATAKPGGYTNMSLQPQSVRHAPSEAGFITARSSVRPLSPTVPSMGRGACSALLSVKNRAPTIAWSNKGIFGEVIGREEPQPEPLPRLSGSTAAPLMGKFGLFTSTSTTNQPISNSKEEEAFFGIFDGLF